MIDFDVMHYFVINYKNELMNVIKVRNNFPKVAIELKYIKLIILIKYKQILLDTYCGCQIIR